MTSTPYLSIVVTGRNDDFGGDFNGRFFRALTFNLVHLARVGVTCEVVLVEWCPIEGRPLLATVLTDALGALLGDRLHAIVVDPKYHDAMSLNPRLQFQEFIAKNVGIRRATGRYVLTTNTDIYLGRHVLAALAGATLVPDTLYRSTRIDLKAGADMDGVDWDVLEDARNYDAINIIKPPLFTNASGDFLLLDRGTYHRLRGFNEVYRKAKIHVDGNFCVQAYRAGVPLVDLGGPVYHVGRGTFQAQRQVYRDRPESAPWGDARWKHKVVYENPDDWGLWGAPARRMAEQVTYLDFDWRAVPPLVALGRLLPGGAPKHLQG